MPKIKAITRTNVPVNGEPTWIEAGAEVVVTDADLAAITAMEYLDRFVALVAEAPKKTTKKGE